MNFDFRIAVACKLLVGQVKKATQKLSRVVFELTNVNIRRKAISRTFLELTNVEITRKVISRAFFGLTNVKIRRKAISGTIVLAEVRRMKHDS